MSWWKVLTIAAAMSVAGLMTSPASAAPAAPGTVKAAIADGKAAATKVHWRRYRHCHRRHGRRYCHGRRHHRAYRYGWPEFGIYFGGRRHHHRHHRRHRKHH